MPTLQEQFGEIDIYIFDQLLRGRIAKGHRILDAGCGSGRNLVYFLRGGFDVHAIDVEAESIAKVETLFHELAPQLGGERATVASVKNLPFPDDAFDVVISVAVLHFARDDADFDAMMTELLRVLAPGGLFFARVASDIGLEDRVEPLGGRRYRIPDGTERYLVDEQRLLEWTERAGATLLDPIKTTNVQGKRCMTTWVLRTPS